MIVTCIYSSPNYDAVYKLIDTIPFSIQALAISDFTGATTEIVASRKAVESDASTQTPSPTKEASQEKRLSLTSRAGMRYYSFYYLLF